MGGLLPTDYTYPFPVVDHYPAINKLHRNLVVTFARWYRPFGTMHTNTGDYVIYFHLVSASRP